MWKCVQKLNEFWDVTSQELCDKRVRLWCSRDAVLAVYNLHHCSDQSSEHWRLTKGKHVRRIGFFRSGNEASSRQYDTVTSTDQQRMEFCGKLILLLVLHLWVMWRILRESIIGCTILVGRSRFPFSCRRWASFLNVIFFGSSKICYVASWALQSMFENRVASTLLDMEFLNDHHVGSREIISTKPILLKLVHFQNNSNVKIKGIIQEEGKFVKLALKAYHCKFSTSFNIAKATSFAGFPWP